MNIFIYTHNLHLKKKGFTLIELLVVISIIALLSSVVLSSLAVAREKARDSKRFSDLRQIQTALEMAKTDGKTLPNETYGYGHTGPSSATSGYNSTLVSFLAPYLPSVPYESKPRSTTSTAYNYYYCNRETFSTTNLCHGDSDTNTYAIVFYTESTSFLGPAGRYCLNSGGFAVPESSRCRQR